MLDAIKGLTGGGKNQKTSDDLQGLIASAKEERSALSTMLTQISMRSAKLTQLGKSLEQVDQKASDTTAKLDVIAKRVEGLEDRAKAFGDVEKRVQGLIDAATQAQVAAEKLMAPDGEIQKHRQQMQQLSSQALETQASVDALKRERATLEEFRATSFARRRAKSRRRSITPTRCAASSIRSAARPASSRRITASSGKRRARRARIRRPRVRPS